MKAEIPRIFYGGAAQARNFQKQEVNLILHILCVHQHSVARSKSHCNSRNSELLRKSWLRSALQKRKLLIVVCRFKGLKVWMLKLLYGQRAMTKQKERVASRYIQPMISQFTQRLHHW